jgi:hypothetical protein
MDFRASYGEEITDASWLKRDIWQLAEQSNHTDHNRRWEMLTKSIKEGLQNHFLLD